jgi:hypothetical protein
MTDDPNAQAAIVRPYYANFVEMYRTAFDLTMDFGYRTPEMFRQKPPTFIVQARVAMSLGHAKSMIPLLARLVAEYEEKFGPIPAPGFDEQARD